MGSRNITTICQSYTIQQYLNIMMQIQNQEAQELLINELYEPGKTMTSVCNALVSFVFITDDNLQKISQQYGKLPKGICAKSIAPTQRSFKCYDCGNDNQYHIYCEACFLNGYHVNHRYKRSLERSGCCDCGDQNAINQVGFCKFHEGFDALNQVELDEGLASRLERGLVMALQQFFALCQKMIYRGQRLDDPEQWSQQAVEQASVLNEQMVIIMEAISHFIVSVCKDMTPILFKIGEILIKERVSTRHHICHKRTLVETFSSGVWGQHFHECQSSLIDLLLRYSLFFEGEKQIVSAILFKLFISSRFKKQLLICYLNNFGFLLQLRQLPDKMLCFKSEIYSIYTQFFSKQLVLTWTSHPNYSSIFKDLGYYLSLTQSKEYVAAYKAIYSIINVLLLLENRFKEFKMEEEVIRCIVSLVEESFNSKIADSLETTHLKYRLNCEFLVIQLATHLMCSIQLTHQNTRHAFRNLLLRYSSLFASSYFKPAQSAYRWYILPEKLMGLILMKCVRELGVSETRQLFEIIPADIVTAALHKLIESYIFCAKLDNSNEVGFINQDTPKDVLRYIYKGVNYYLYDLDMLTIQLFAVLMNADHFLQIILTKQELKDKEKFILEIMVEESFYVNMSEICGNEKDSRAHEAKKAYVIQAFNFKKRMSFEDLFAIFDKTIFNKKVEFEEALGAICNFNKQDAVFQLKPAYYGLRENFYFQRNRLFYEKLYENMDRNSVAALEFNNLIRSMVSNKINTFCFEVTSNLMVGHLFNSFVLKIYQMISLGDITFERLKIFDLYTLRQSNNVHFLNTCKQIRSKAEQPSPICNFFIQSLEKDMSVNKPAETTQHKKETRNPRANKILLQMQAKQKKFIESNDIPEPTKEVEHADCLICHNHNANEVRVMMLTKFKMKAKYPHQCFNTCRHVFHTQCLIKKGAQQCPLCGLLFKNLLPMIDTYYDFYSRISQRSSIQLKASVLNNTYILNSINRYIAFEYNSDPNQSFSSLSLVYMIVSKILLCLSEPALSFQQKYKNILRSIVCIIAQNKLDQSRSSVILQTTNQVFMRCLIANKSDLYQQLLFEMLVIALTHDSQKTYELFRQLISKFYNGFLAANIISYYGKEPIAINDIGKCYENKKEILEAYNREFYKGIVFTYSLIYDDQDFEQFYQHEQGFNVNNHHFFQLSIDSLCDFYSIGFKAGDFEFSQTPLLQPIRFINLPANYKQFHQLYYETCCRICKSLPYQKLQSVYICLICGFSACSKNCTPKAKSQLTKHGKLEHCGTTVYIQSQFGTILVTKNQVGLNYGSVYSNEVGIYDNEKEKNWGKLVKSYNKIDRLLALLNNRQIELEIFSKAKNPLYKARIL